MRVGVVFIRPASFTHLPLRATSSSGTILKFYKMYHPLLYYLSKLPLPINSNILVSTTTKWGRLAGASQYFTSDMIPPLLTRKVKILLGKVTFYATLHLLQSGTLEHIYIVLVHLFKSSSNRSIFLRIHNVLDRYKKMNTYIKIKWNFIIFSLTN